MQAEENKLLLDSMVVALNAHDIEAHDHFWSKDMIWHGPPSFGDIHGLEAFKHEVLKPFFTAFPDFHGTIDIEIVQGDWIAATGFVTGTHLGEWLGIPPTGKPVKMRYSEFLALQGWLVSRELGHGG